MELGSKDSLIARQRDRLFSAEQFFADFSNLENKRIQLEEKISKLSTEIEKMAFFPEKNLEEEKQQLRLLKKEMQSIDIIWNEWEDLSEKELYGMRDSLFDIISQLYPNQYFLELEQWSIFKEGLIHQHQLKKIQSSLQQLHDRLKTVLKARAGVQGFGILKYIFGISPNLLIENQLQTIANFITSFEKELKSAILNCSHIFLTEIYAEIYKEIENLKIHCKSVWGFRHIDTVIAEYEKIIGMRCERLQTCHQEYEDHLIELKNKMDNWLKTF